MRGMLAAAVALAAAILLAGCTDNSGVPSAATTTRWEQQDVQRLRALPFDDGALAVVTDVLKAAGVAIADDGATAAPAVVRLTRWQVRNLAVEAANGGGVPAATLATLAVAPAGAPPVPYLVAAWASTYDSRGARFAKTLLASAGDAAPKVDNGTVIPKLALILFLADATAGPTATSAVVPAAFRAELAGPCTTATAFVQNAIASVANALKVNTSGGGFLGFLGKIWNAAIDLAKGAVQGLIDTVTRPVVNLLVDVFGVVATIAQVTSFLSSWRTDLKADPDDTRYGVDDQVVTGRMTLHVDTAELPIPDLVIDCAAAVGVNLREAGSPAGSKVTWDADNRGPGDLSARVSADDKLNPDKAASYTYQTGQESGDVARTGEEHAGYVWVTATVQRNDIEKVRQLFARLVLDQIPAVVRPIVEPLARPVLEAATRHLAAISDVKASGGATIRYHSAKDVTPPPVAATGASGAVARIPPDCPLTTMFGHGYGYIDRDSQHGLPGTLVCLYAQPRAGSAYLNIGLFPYAFTSADIPAGARTIPIPGASSAWLSDTCMPKPCHRLDVVVGDQTLSVAGGDAESDVIIDITKRVLGVA